MSNDMTSLLYDLSRKIGKAASVSNDVKNVANGHPERILKKAVKREMHKNLNKILRNI